MSWRLCRTVENGTSGALTSCLGLVACCVRTRVLIEALMRLRAAVVLALSLI